MEPASTRPPRWPALRVAAASRSSTAARPARPPARVARAALLAALLAPLVAKPAGAIEPPITAPPGAPTASPPVAPPPSTPAPSPAAAAPPNAAAPSRSAAPPPGPPALGPSLGPESRPPPPPPPDEPPAAVAPPALVDEEAADADAPDQRFGVVPGRRHPTPDLPFDLAAGLYLHYYQPVTGDSVLAGANLDQLAGVDSGAQKEGALRGTFQIHAFYLRLDKAIRGLGAHVELRARDGGHVGAGDDNARLRPFFTSNVWFQEAYAYYSPHPVVTLKAGKVYRQVGLFWDGSFIGNLAWFDGLKLNPDYGLSLEGDVALARRRVSLGWTAQMFVVSDGINGGLEGGRTVGPRPSATMGAEERRQAARVYGPNPEGALDSAGRPMGSLRNVFDGRLRLALRPTRRVAIELGASALSGTVVRSSTTDGVDDSAGVRQIGADLTLRLGPVLLYGEYLHQGGLGVRTADYVLAGARARFGDFALRVNVSTVDYALPGGDVSEYIVQPGLTWTMGGGLSALVEVNEWQRKDPRLRASDGTPVLDWITFDRSVSLVLACTY